MVLYTLMGGLWPCWSRISSSLWSWPSRVVILAPLAYLRAGGGAAILDKLPEGFLRPTAGAYTWPWLLSFAVVLALTFAVKWPYVQRYYVVRSDAEARRVGYLVAALTFVGPPFCFFRPWPRGSSCPKWTT